MTTVDDALPSVPPVLRRGPVPRQRWRARRPFVVALGISIALHLAFSFWPEPVPETPDSVPLQATLTELPPPPVVVTPEPPKQKPRPRKRRASPPPVPAPVQEEAPVVADAAPSAPAEAATAAEPAPAEAPPAAAVPAPAVAEETELPPPPLAEVPDKTLPPRVDLVYRVFYGTQGFFVGDATYRFEHSANRYRIATVGEARGLAALILRGQGRIESEGLITSAGLQPDQFALERGKGRKREVAVFDWEAGMVTLDDDKSAPLELPTYDPLAFLWQFYFLPPTTDEQSFAIATTRRVYRYTFTREATEPIELPSGTVQAERWHRRSEDGKTDAFVWLAPTMHYVAVKMRFSNTDRGTVEALLDAIRVDETVAQR